jgi:hypothetical protein
MVRAIVVGAKTLVWYINNYRLQREKEKIEYVTPREGANEEVFSALSKITHTEHALIDKYIVLAFPCIKVLKREDPEDGDSKSSPEQSYRDTLTYFAVSFHFSTSYFVFSLSNFNHRPL